MNILIEYNINEQHQGFYPSIVDNINMKGEGTKIKSVPWHTILVPITITIIFLRLVDHLAFALHTYGTNKLVGVESSEEEPCSIISTKGALRLPTTYDNHPIYPHIAVKTTSPLKI